MNSIWADFCRKSIRDYLNHSPNSNSEFKREDLINRYRNEWFVWRRSNNYSCTESALQAHVDDVLRWLVNSHKLKRLDNGWYRVIGEIASI